MQLGSTTPLARPTRRAAKVECLLRVPGRSLAPRRLQSRPTNYALVSKLDILQASSQLESRSVEFWGVEELLQEPLSPRDVRRVQAGVPQNILHFVHAGRGIAQQQQQQQDAAQADGSTTEAVQLAQGIAEQLAALADSTQQSLATASRSADPALLQCLQQLASSCGALAEKQQHLVQLLSGEARAPTAGTTSSTVAAGSDALMLLQAQLQSLVVEPPATSAEAASLVSDHIATSARRPIVGMPVAAGPALAQPCTVRRVHMGSALVKGRKHAVMEDRHALASFDLASAGLLSKPGCCSAAGPTAAALGAVFDGHGGWLTADHAAAFLPDLVCAGLTGRGRPASAGGPVLPAVGPLRSSDALEGALGCFDRWWSRGSETMEYTGNLGHDNSGCTAVLGLVQGRQLTCANVGDSVAVLARSGAAHRLSVSHTAHHSEEAARVVAAGGRVGPAKPGGAHRVWRGQQYCSQGLMVTRSLGDFGFKRDRLIIPTPHLVQEELTLEDTMLLLTSDGVTDALSDSAMLEVAMEALHQARRECEDGQQLAQAAAAAVVRAAREGGSTDDITAVAMLMDWA